MSPKRILFGLTVGIVLLVACYAAVWYWQLSPLSAPVTLLLISATVGGLLSEFHRRAALRPYWDRLCTGSEWKQRFPEEPKTQIRAFLDVFIDAFGLPVHKRLSFSPHDRVLDLYHALYPLGEGLADAMELEKLSLGFQRRYQCDLATFWREDITLGELYARTHHVA
jgi:propanediol dehydratase small subunit